MQVARSGEVRHPLKQKGAATPHHYSWEEQFMY